MPFLTLVCTRAGGCILISSRLFRYESLQQKIFTLINLTLSEIATQITPETLK